MKRKIYIILCVMLLCLSALFAGCSKEKKKQESDRATSGDATVDRDESEPSGDEAEETTAPEETEESAPEETADMEFGLNVNAGALSFTEGVARIEGYDTILYVPMPENWTLDETGSSPTFVSPDYPYAVDNITLSIRENDGSLRYTTEEIIKDTYSQVFDGFKLDMYESGDQNGHLYIEFRYLVGVGNTILHMHTISFSTDKTIYTITMSNDNDKGSVYYEEFMKCLKQAELAELS